MLPLETVLVFICCCFQMTKRKMEDVKRKLEALYDRLRSGVVSAHIFNFIVPKTSILLL